LADFFCLANVAKRCKKKERVLLIINNFGAIMDKSNLLKLTKDSYRLTLMFPKREPLRCKIREVADDILAGLITRKKNDMCGIDDQLDLIDSFFDVAREQNWVAMPLIDEVKNGYLALRPESATNLLVAAEQPMAKPLAEKPKEKPVAKENVIYAPAAKIPPLISHATLNVAVQPVAQAYQSAVSGSVGAPLPNLGENATLEDEGQDDASVTTNGELTDGQILRQNSIVEYLKEKGQAQVWEIQKIFPNISKRTIRRDFRSLLKQELIERVGERNKTYYKMKVNII